MRSALAARPRLGKSSYGPARLPLPDPPAAMERDSRTRMKPAVKTKLERNVCRAITRDSASCAGLMACSEGGLGGQAAGSRTFECEKDRTSSEHAEVRRVVVLGKPGT